MVEIGSGTKRGLGPVPQIDDLNLATARRVTYPVGRFQGDGTPFGL